MAADVSPRRWWILATLSLTLLVVGLDATVLNVALSDISRALGASNTDLQWVANGYVLVFAVLLMPAGVLGDHWGRARVLGGGLVVFVTASAFAAWSASPAALIVARAVMGIGAAAAFPLALSIIPTVFSGKERSKAVAVLTAAMGLGMPIGPLLGGWLLDRYWWGSTLLINVPLVLVALVGVIVLVPNSRDDHPATPDVRGLTLSAIGIAATVFALIEQPVHGFGSLRVALPLALGVAALGAFAVVETRAPAPLVERELVRSRLFVGGTLAATVGAFVVMGLLFTMPLFLQSVRGESALGTGLRLMPLMLALVVGSALAPPLQRGLGLRGPLTAGFVITAGGLLMARSVTQTSSDWTLAAALVTIGLGFGVAMPPAQDAVLGSLPAGREGAGTGLNQAVKQLGGVISVAILGSIVASAYRRGVESVAQTLPAPAADAVRDSLAGATAVAGHLPHTIGASVRATAEQAYVSGMHTAALVSAIVAILAAAAFALALPGKAPEPAAATARPEPVGSGASPA